eukprot:3684972-Pyramimonas_sp.AAC.1
MKGSSALQAAMLREVGHEVARFRGMCSVGAHWDLKRFFDSIDPHRLVGFALKMDDPVHLLYLGFLVHAAPRVLEVGGFASDIIAPECSIVAGCMQSMSWVKIYIYELLDSVHVQFRPVAIKGH